MKKLPIGIQSFEVMRTRGFVYVDKTETIHRLVTEGMYYFMARPRRFGKSLLVSTLRCLFEGRRELFEGLWIAEPGRWDWQPHPVVVFVAQESAKARPDERLLGSSEVIESVLGKLKRLEQDQAKSGFTGLLLSIGAMVASNTLDVILKALKTVPTKKVLAWCKETLGRSVQAKRQEALISHGKSEQKWEQSWGAV